MRAIRWASYPQVAATGQARAWLEVQALLSLAPTTLAAYGRALEDYLTFCQRAVLPITEATKATIAAYVDDMTRRPNPRGDAVRYLHSGTGLANATMQQRLTVVRLFYDQLIDDRQRQDERNPVGRGTFTPGRAFAGKR